MVSITKKSIAKYRKGFSSEDAKCTDCNKCGKVSSSNTDSSSHDYLFRISNEVIQ